MLGPNLARRRRGILLLYAISNSVGVTLDKAIKARGDPSGVLREFAARNASGRHLARSRSLGISPIPYV